MLVVERGIPGVRVLRLDQPVCLLGAAPDSHIFVDNPYISRTHAQFVREGKRYRIRDLGSKNGTYINGVRLTSEGHLLQRGDKIELAEGQVLLRFQTRGSTVTLPVARAASSGALVVDAKSREVWVEGSRLESPLSRKEFDVLNLLVEKRGEACTKDEIAAAGWPERNGGDVGDHEIEQSVRRLRLRLEPDPSQPKYVITVRGYGYKVPQE
jgi:DNA-binding winged helix-turn-helix (wHTH) protein